MPETTQPSEPAPPSNPTGPRPHAGRGGYNGSPNPNAPPLTTSAPSPGPKGLSPDTPSFGGRGEYQDSPASTSPFPPQPIPYPPPNTHLEQPQPINPPFGGRGSDRTSPQSQSPVPTFAIGRHSPPSEPEHGGFGGRGGYQASQGPEAAPVSLHAALTFAEYEAEHGHGVTSRKGSVQGSPGPGFGGRGGYQAATGAETPPAPGSLHHTPTFAEYEAEHGHASLSRKASVQESPGPGFGGRGGYHAAGGPDQPLGLPHRAATFAEYEQEHGHGTETRKGAATTPEPGYGGRGGGYHANPPAAGALSPEGHFPAPHRAQTFSEYEAEHQKAPVSRKASLQETPQPGFGGRGGYNADPPATLSPDGPSFAAPHRAQTFAEYEAKHHGPSSGKTTPEPGVSGTGHHASAGTSPALSPSGPFAAPHRAHTFAEHEPEHLHAGFRALGLQDAPEHGFGGRGGYHASTGGGSGSGSVTPSEPPFAAPHRAQTFAEYEAERGRGVESRKGSTGLPPPSERELERRGSFPPREEGEDARMEGRDRERERERGAGALEGMGHPGFGGRGGYQRPG
ncbi:hypothetical protein MMC26_004869 [Xylographa opegraphella]|nr:hypothetical protein [Xylographa opegraphella]